MLQFIVTEMYGFFFLLFYLFNFIENVFFFCCVFQDSNLTSSILTLRVSAENDGAELTCRATNPWFNGGALEEKRIINVACKFFFIGYCLILKSFLVNV